MLPTNFDFLANEKPELKQVITRLSEWARQHRDWKAIDPRIVNEDIKDVDPFMLSFALHQLVARGLFRQVYMVASPSGAFAEGEYDDPNEIPIRLTTRFDEFFSRDDGAIVSLLKPV